jgi:IclR family acetate operon transcriptional repressor
VQTLDRALSLIELLAEADGLSLTDLSQRAGMSPATVYRMLTTMERRGFVANDQAQGLWRIGVETFRAGSAFARGTKVVDVGRAVMRGLMESTGETANLAIEEDGDVVFLSQVETHEAIRAFFRPGTRGPMHASGIGKALLAARPARRVRAILQQRGLAGFTPKTLVSPDGLLADLEVIRKRGWALDDEERHQGMRCIAAPIFDEHGEAVAGVSVSGPTVRMSDDRLVELAALVKQAAAAITDGIGGVRAGKVKAARPGAYPVG